LLLIFLLSPYFVTYPRSLHDALPISVARPVPRDHAGGRDDGRATVALPQPGAGERGVSDMAEPSNDVLLDVRDLAVHFPIKRGLDRKSTRLNSSHVKISYAVFCLKKK